MNTTQFLPEDYKLPDNSRYTRLKDGRNKLRVLSSAIIGYEYFNTNNKPVRSKAPFKTIPDDIGLDRDGKTKRIKHFWAFVVWNYDTKSVQVLEITQSTIQSQIKALVDDEVWGRPQDYDITITRTGEGFDTEYNVNPTPHSELSDEIKEAYESETIELNALFTNENPFKTSK